MKNTTINVLKKPNYNIGLDLSQYNPRPQCNMHNLHDGISAHMGFYCPLLAKVMAYQKDADDHRYYTVT